MLRAEPQVGFALDDIDYPGGFYRDLAPVHLHYICAMNGIEGPALSSPFAYCELGCGIGETTLFLAACYPNGRFWGLDLNASHIDQARSLARDSGLSNVEFIKADVATFDRDQLPDFDFVTMHGLYAWVSPAVRAEIRGFLSEKLKPAGLAYLSYNAMPGWGAASALRQYFVQRAARLEGDAIEVARKVINELVDLERQKAPFFRDNPSAAGIVLRLKSADPHYVVHEYLGTDWHPRYFSEVYDEMTAAGLEFVAEAGVVESLLEHSVAPEFVEGLRDAPDVRERESLRDFIQNRFFRRDIYRKPPGEASITPNKDPLRRVLFSLSADPRQIPNTVNITDAPAISFEGSWFDRLKQLLGYRVLSLDELLADPVLATFRPEQLIESIQLFSVSGFCVPCLTRETEPPRQPTEFIRVVPTLNALRLERHDWSTPSLTLASPVLGSGITLNSLESVLLWTLHTRQKLEDVAGRLRQKGIAVRSEEDKAIIDDDEKSLQALKHAMQQFESHKLPKLAYMGVVAPTD